MSPNDGIAISVTDYSFITDSQIAASISTLLRPRELRRPTLSVGWASLLWSWEQSLGVTVRTAVMRR